MAIAVTLSQPLTQKGIASILGGTGGADGGTGAGGALVFRVGTLALDSSYPTNGEALAASAFELGSVVFAHFMRSGGYVFEYDYTNSKIKAYYGDWNNASDGPLIEVPNTTDLSALTAIPFFIIGRA